MARTYRILLHIIPPPHAQGKPTGRGKYLRSSFRTRTPSPRARCCRHCAVPSRLSPYGRYLHAADQSVYEGEWVDGQKEGRAVEKFANGDSYKGRFKASKREGRGTLPLA